jgi:hypothetical protein
MRASTSVVAGRGPAAVAFFRGREGLFLGGLQIIAIKQLASPL